MGRLTLVALLMGLASTPSGAEPVSSTQDWRFRDIGFAADPGPRLPAATIGTTGRLGLGIFGVKSEVGRQRAVTVREIDAPRQRRAGVGFSLKF